MIGSKQFERELMRDVTYQKDVETLHKIEYEIAMLKGLVKDIDNMLENMIEDGMGDIVKKYVEHNRSSRRIERDIKALQNAMHTYKDKKSKANPMRRINVYDLQLEMDKEYQACEEMRQTKLGELDKVQEGIKDIEIIILNMLGKTP